MADIFADDILHHGTCVAAIVKNPMGFLSDSGHERAVMHAGIAN